MISISAKQAGRLSEIQLGKFKQRLRAHLEKFFPDRLQSASDDEFGDFAEFAIEKAKGFQLHSERAVAYFSHLILLLGANFETDKTNTFAARILRDESCGIPPEDRVKIAMNLAHQLHGKGALDQHQ